jgi:hypothetical protein
MYCSRSISVHLLRGLGAVALITLAVMYGAGHRWLAPLLLVGAVVLLGGCPMCWLAGLFETMANRRNSAPT